MAAFRGLCCTLINESTVAAGRESLFLSVSAFCAEQNNEPEKRNKKKNIENGKKQDLFCISLPGSVLKSGVSFHRDIHLPENVVEFIE